MQIHQIDIKELLKGYGFGQRMRDELLVLLEGNLHKILSRTRRTSSNTSLRTQAYRAFTICRTIQQIRELGYKIESPYSLTSKHIDAVVRVWVSNGETSGTMQNKLSHLKAFLQWMGKFNLHKPLHEYISKKEQVELGLERHYVAQEDKSWGAHGINAGELIARVERDDPRVALQLEIQAAFGVRKQEAAKLNIRKTVANMLTRTDGKFLVEIGTKGGRPRNVPLRVQAAVLQKGLRFANPRFGSLIPEDMNYDQWDAYYYRVLSRHGITKTGLGITSHGLRHEYAHRYYEEETGVKAPIKGGEERPDIEKHKAALREVIEALGHSMAQKTGMYLSTWAAQEKRTAPVVGIEDVRRALEETGGEKKAAAAKLGISRQALYRILDKAKREAGE